MSYREPRSYRIWHRTEKSPDRNHKVNQDRYMTAELIFLEDKPLRVWAVCDGMGGYSDGEISAQNALTAFMETIYRETMRMYMESRMDHFSLKYTAGELAAVMEEAIQEANLAVCRKADPMVKTGTTISAVAAFDDFAIVGNVGDSPVYFYRRKKHRMMLASDLQTEAERQVSQGVYERYSDAYYEDSHLVTANLGHHAPLAEEEICIRAIGQISVGDIFLMGSDGAFGKIRDEELKEEYLDRLQPSGYPECDEEWIPQEDFLDELFAAAAQSPDDQTAILCMAE